MDNKNAQSQTPSVWSTEVGEVPSSTHPRREEGIRADSRNDGSFDRGNVGEIGKRRDSDLLRTITGGIITQLIEEAESQLGETRACIQWYEEKEKEQTRRLANLQQLRELRDHLPTEEE